MGEGSNANCQIAETNTATGEEMGNCLDSYTNPTHKTINDDRGGNLTISLSDITGEKVGNCPSTPTPNNANGLGAVSFLSENKNYVGDQKGITVVWSFGRRSTLRCRPSTSGRRPRRRSTSESRLPRLGRSTPRCRQSTPRCRPPLPQCNQRSTPGRLR